MSDAQLLLLLGGLIYICPHLPKWAGLTGGSIMLLMFVVLRIWS